MSCPCITLMFKSCSFIYQWDYYTKKCDIFAGERNHCLEISNFFDCLIVFSYYSSSLLSEQWWSESNKVFIKL